jgi:hypothetical protein
MLNSKRIYVFIGRIGQWCMVNGQSSMVNGQSSMVNREWAAEGCISIRTSAH